MWSHTVFFAPFWCISEIIAFAPKQVKWIDRLKEQQNKPVCTDTGHMWALIMLTIKSLIIAAGVSPAVIRKH